MHRIRHRLRHFYRKRQAKNRKNINSSSLFVFFSVNVFVFLCLLVCLCTYLKSDDLKSQTRKILGRLLVESFGSRKPMFTQCCCCFFFAHFICSLVFFLVFLAEIDQRKETDVLFSSGIIFHFDMYVVRSSDVLLYQLLSEDK